MSRVTDVIVDTVARTLTAFDRTISCAIGRSGAGDSATKREGDGCTPRGRFALRTALLRPDRVQVPKTALPWRWLRPDDGWSDDPADPTYNRPVRHPHAWSAERLWRDDGAYDIIVVIGWNDAPVVPGHGSAIFLHCSQPGATPTAGCIATDRTELSALLARLQPGATITIS